MVWKIPILPVRGRKSMVRKHRTKVRKFLKSENELLDKPVRVEGFDTSPSIAGRSITVRSATGRSATACSVTALGLAVVDPPVTIPRTSGPPPASQSENSSGMQQGSCSEGQDDLSDSVQRNVTTSSSTIATQTIAPPPVPIQDDQVTTAPPPATIQDDQITTAPVSIKGTPSVRTRGVTGNKTKGASSTNSSISSLTNSESVDCF